MSTLRRPYLLTYLPTNLMTRDEQLDSAPALTLVTRARLPGRSSRSIRFRCLQIWDTIGICLQFTRAASALML